MTKNVITNKLQDHGMLPDKDKPTPTYLVNTDLLTPTDWTNFNADNKWQTSIGCRVCDASRGAVFHEYEVRV